MRWPSNVSRGPRRSRSKSLTPMRDSRRASRRLTVACVMFNLRAARLKLPVWTTSKKTRKSSQLRSSDPEASSNSVYGNSVIGIPQGHKAVAERNTWQPQPQMIALYGDGLRRVVGYTMPVVSYSEINSIVADSGASEPSASLPNGG